MSVEYRIGDVRALLAEMPAGSTDLIVTSPPYLSLRSYLVSDDPMKALEIGSERTPAEYIATLLGITAEFRRVLAPHGSIAIELGDTFSGSGGAGGDYNENGLREGQAKFSGSARKRAENGVGDEYRPSRSSRNRTRDSRPGREAMDSSSPARPEQPGGMGWPLERSLAMIPELYRVALAYGIHPLTGEVSPAGRWRVRNVVVHGRPNPPVGALGDKYRPACSYWAVACVNRRWFDLDAVRGPLTGHGYTEGSERRSPDEDATGRNWSNGLQERKATHDGAPPLDWFEDECDQFERDLWTIPTFGYKGAHYATFAPELVRRFIVSMCPARVCRECGKPSTRITDVSHKANRSTNGPQSIARRHLNGGSAGFPVRTERQAETLGWTDCGHGGNWRPGVVLDPFGGTGTTGMVAAGNGRDALLFDLDGRNLDLARQRIGMFLDEPA